MPRRIRGTVYVDNLVGNAVRQVVIAGTNATALGLTDVGTVVSILAFTTSGLAIATKGLLELTTDYTVAAGDVTPAGNLSAQTLVITYLPK